MPCRLLSLRCVSVRLLQLIYLLCLFSLVLLTSLCPLSPNGPGHRHFVIAFVFFSFDLSCLDLPSFVSCCFVSFVLCCFVRSILSCLSHSILVIAVLNCFV